IDRDGNLRARWSRYALIGAAMRSEPVATARSGFARRVSAALQPDTAPARGTRARRLFWSTALAASLVAGVAGLSISLLRDAALGAGSAPGQPPGPTQEPLSARNTAPAPLPTPDAAPADSSADQAEVLLPGQGTLSYVTPRGARGGVTMLRTELADYIVAHSAYSTPLLRRNVLSELVTSEDGTGIVSSYTDAAGTAQGTAAGGSDAIRSASDSSR
ncbi:MAG TPA: sigma-E factor negative regulatory protein, partial [Steroidobacteraceae bacterium]